MMIVKRNILLNPGPATTTDSVKLAQVVPDICPREKEFGRMMAFVSDELTRVVADPNDFKTVLFGGSGTAAVESIISSVVDGTAIIVNNGAYGQRMCEIAAAYGLDYLAFNSSPDEGVDLTALESFIQSSQRSISHLAVVHLETTTGLLNDIGSIGEICRKYGIDLIVDAMSSFAAVRISMVSMNIGFLAASSNKCVQGMAGVSFCIANKQKLERLRHQKPRNYYLNLFSQYDYFSKSGQMRFTPPVQTLYALKQAIAELKQEGIEQRYRRYCASWEKLISGLDRLGLKHIVSDIHHSKIVTSVIEPVCDGYDFQDMHDYFYAKGFTIYPGKLDDLNTFRIANIGDIDDKDIEAFLQLLEQYLRGIGYTFG